MIGGFFGLLMGLKKELLSLPGLRETTGDTESPPSVIGAFWYESGRLGHERKLTALTLKFNKIAKTR